jgi:murein L,D-transpeptidase YcbB/YkuD
VNTPRKAQTRHPQGSPAQTNPLLPAPKVKTVKNGRQNTPKTGHVSGRLYTFAAPMNHTAKTQSAHYQANMLRLRMLPQTTSRRHLQVGTIDAARHTKT